MCTDNEMLVWRLLVDIGQMITTIVAPLQGNEVT